MQFLMTATVVIAGLAFSLAIALLVEELIFGKVLGLFFVPQTAAQETSRPNEPRVGWGTRQTAVRVESGQKR
jgi:hypothetical protein